MFASLCLEQFYARSSLVERKNMGQLGHFSQSSHQSMWTCGFPHNSVSGIGAFCEKSQNSVTGLPWERIALVIPGKVYSGTGCDSWDQVRLYTWEQGNSNSFLEYLTMKIIMDLGTGDLKNTKFVLWYVWHLLNWESDMVFVSYKL